MKNILVPIDFSDCSKNATVFAANIARKTGAEIHLLHVIENVETDQGLGTTGSWAGASEATAVPIMIDRLKMIKSRMQEIISSEAMNGIPAHDFIEVGEPYIKINEGAEKQNADMIVMGTHGTSGISRIFIGSVADKVVQHADRPVLSIKDPANLNPATILFASDFTEEADAIFTQVQIFANIFSSSVHLLKVIEKTESSERDKAMETLQAFAVHHEANSSLCHVVTANKSEEGIILFSKRNSIDLIAIGTHGRSGLSRFFNPSISAELVNHAFCPVLTINFKG